MGKDVSALDGEHLEARQIPLALVQLSIPGAFVAITDLDTPIYLNTTTLAGGLIPVTGGTQFLPGAGLKLPAIAESDGGLSECQISAANADGFWWDVINANAYREAPATIWQGNLVLAMNQAPDAATLAGVFVRYVGHVTSVRATRRQARVTLRPGPSPMDMKLPYRTFPPDQYKRIPPEGTRLSFGWTERTL